MQRLYRAARCENASPETPIRRHASLAGPNDVTMICETVHQGFFAEMESIRPHSGSNPRLLCLTNVYFGQRCRELKNGAMGKFGARPFVILELSCA